MNVAQDETSTKRKRQPAILVVEDERVIARDLAASLGQMGYEVTGIAASSVECLRHARARRPDLVLMDVRIEGATDGVETARLLRQELDLPVVFLTAFADDDTVARARETEPHGYVLKPFRSSELKSAIEIALYKHRAEKQLRDREHWFSTTLRSIGDAVITVDGGGGITFMNHVAEDLTRKSEAEAKGRNAWEVVRLIDEQTRKPVANPLAKALSERRLMRLPPNTALTTGDAELPIDDSVAPIVDDSGNLLGAVIVFRDTSEARKLQEQVALADRLTSLGLLAAGVAHEIHNPLMYVLANTTNVREQLDRLAAELSPPATQAAGGDALRGRLLELAELVSEAHEGAERIRKIASDMRAFGRPDSSRETGDVVAALEWALRVTVGTLQQRARLVKLLEPVPRVRAPDARLGQVLLNLIMNAIQAIPEGHAYDHAIWVSTRADGAGSVLVVIEDNGVGMTPDVMKRIFEPFFTTKPLGTGSGLGLSICHGIVRSLGGDIAVESTLGKGTKFTVRLPIAEGALSILPRSARPEELRRGRILVVDDEPLLANTYARMLRPIHDIAVATSGEDALERLRSDAEFDIVFCDLMMPGMSGIDLYCQLNEEMPDLAERMVFTTGGAFTPGSTEFLQSLPNPHLVKPFTAANINDLVQSLLREASNGAPDEGGSVL